MYQVLSKFPDGVTFREAHKRDIQPIYTHSLRTGDFVEASFNACMPLLMATSTYGLQKSIKVLLSGINYTTSIPETEQQPKYSFVIGT